MGILTGLFHSRDKPKNSLGSAFSPLFGGTTSGKTVNEHTALQTTAVYACVRILAETVAGLPLHVYQYRMDGRVLDRAWLDRSRAASWQPDMKEAARQRMLNQRRPR